MFIRNVKDQACPSCPCGADKDAKGGSKRSPTLSQVSSSAARSHSSAFQFKSSTKHKKKP